MQLLCGQCGQTLQVDDALAGGTHKCPHCGHEISVPFFGGMDLDSQTLSTPPPSAGAPPADDGGGGFADAARQSMSRRVRLVCGKCSKGFSVGVRFAGKKAKCPACGTKVLIPHPDEDLEQELQALPTIDEEQLDAAEEPIEIYDQDEKPIDLNAFKPSHRPKPAPPRPAHAHRPRRKPLGAIIAAGVAAVVLIVLIIPASRAAVFAALGISTGPKADDNASANTAQNDLPSNVPVVTAAPPTLKVDSIRAELFASGGYFPAPPGQVYLKVAITVIGGGEKFMLSTDSPTLQAGDQSYTSLGQESAGAVVPVRATRQAIFIDAKAVQKLTLLFLVPEKLAKARLVAPPMEAALTLPSAPRELPADAAVGAYVEAPPRNLKPVLADPVMAALQTTPAQSLEVVKDGPALAVRIPAAGVRGVLQPSGPCLYQARLDLGSQSLQCKFRLAQDGKLLVLYLTDDPFHQITYQRK